MRLGRRPTENAHLFGPQMLPLEPVHATPPSPAELWKLDGMAETKLLPRTAAGQDGVMQQSRAGKSARETPTPK